MSTKVGRSSSRPAAADHPPAVFDRRKAPFDRLKLPIATLLDITGGPAALWSEDRRWCAMNPALGQLLGYGEEDFRDNPALWASRVDPSDRERFSAFWQATRQNGDGSSCRYRFLPASPRPVVELYETVQRLVAPGGAVLLSRYTVSRGATERRRIAHKIGNHLQAARGEVDLLRLNGTLPEQNAAIICQAIDAVHELVEEIRKYEL